MPTFEKKNPKEAEGLEGLETWLTLVDIGTGDGERTDFPVPDHDGTVLLFTDGFMANRSTKSLRKVGGEERYVDEVTKAEVVTERDQRLARFEDAPRFGAVLYAGLVGVKGDTALLIRPNTVACSKALQRRVVEMRRQKKLTEGGAEEILHLYGLWFDHFVVEWNGFTSKAGEPHPCTSEMKASFIDNVDAGTYGYLVVQVAEWLQKHREDARTAEERD
jgi:hypothetical protein